MVVQGTTKGSVDISNKVISMADRIDVGGKEIEAVRVDSVIKVSVTFRGRTIPTSDVRVTNWYSKDLYKIAE